MTFGDGSFDFAVDKGTLDALCADSSPETATRVVQYLNEIVRVLNPKGGTYICVSLLQDFVLDALVTFFQKGFGNNLVEDSIFDFRIQKIEKVTQKTSPDGSAMLPFFVTVKRTQIPQEPKLQELRKKMSETVYFQDSPAGKSEMVNVDIIDERIKKE